MAISSHKRSMTPAQKIGDKIIVIRDDQYTRPKPFHGLYYVGDILTVAQFSNHRLEYHSGFHINAVEEFQTPEEIDTLILPTEYKVLKDCYDCSPRPSERLGTNLIPEVRDEYYCPCCENLWQESGLGHEAGKALFKEAVKFKHSGEALAVVATIDAIHGKMSKSKSFT